MMGFEELTTELVRCEALAQEPQLETTVADP
jgi:hypothetical protein